MRSDTSNTTLAEIAGILAGAEKILILTHDRPDGDTLGSAFAIKHSLAGKDVRVACSDPVPARLAFIADGARELRPGADFRPDLVVAVDCAETGMMGEYGRIYGASADIKIDHHRTSVPFAKYNYIDADAAACAEIIYELVLLLGDMTCKAALALYSGIATDTGCFKFRNVSPESHRIAAELLRYDFDAGKINNLLFECKSASEIRATKAALNTLHYYADGKIAVVCFSDELKKANAITDEDLSALNSLPREIDGVELGVTIKQIDGDATHYKVSMRSGETVDASALCAHFGGGGHLRAAGCEIEAATAEEAENTVISYVKETVIF